MTVDIHFQLNEDEPEGYQALAILSTWEQQGHPVDDVMRRALLALGERQQANQATTTAVYVKDIIKEMRDLLEEVQTLKVLKAEEGASSASPGKAEAEPIEEKEPEKEAAQLSQAFLNAVKKAARPGLRLD